MFKSFFKKSYVYILIAIFYIPLIVGAVYSFSASGKKSMPAVFNYTGEGWNKLFGDQNITMALLNSLILALLVSSIVVAVGLITVFGLWRQKNKTAKGFVNGTANIPLINPDIITAISLALAFGVMFGTMSRNDTGYFRLLFAHVTMILPFGITLMYPRSEKFKLTLFEASKDLGYGPIKTWFKTYFRHMVPVALASFGVAFVLSLDDFVITRIVSKEDTIGKLMYQGTLKPWVLALGTTLMFVTLTITAIFGIITSRRERRVRKVKK